MKEIIKHDILIPSLKKLYQIDFDNIKNGVSERNICARLAHHMENIMREYDSKNSGNLFSKYYVDVEYNRMENGNLKKYENSVHRPKYMVSDLLVQSRGQEINLLAAELKRKGNKKILLKIKDVWNQWYLHEHIDLRLAVCMTRWLVLSLNILLMQ